MASEDFTVAVNVTDAPVITVVAELVNVVVVVVSMKNPAHPVSPATPTDAMPLRTVRLCNPQPRLLEKLFNSATFNSLYPFRRFMSQNGLLLFQTRCSARLLPLYSARTPMAKNFTTARLEAFSDGVIAVIITIMVLDLKVPGVHEMSAAEAIRLNLRILVFYLLSFIQTGIYWVNHHYLLEDLEHVTHTILWANLALLFGLSLIPFGTNWIGVRGVTPAPMAVYAVCFLLPAVAWAWLASVICNHTQVRPAAGPLQQGFSLAMNAGAIAVSRWSPWTAFAMIGCIAFLWLLPPARIRDKTRQFSPSGRSTRHSA